MVLSILLVKKKLRLLNRYVLSYPNEWIHKILWKRSQKHVFCNQSWLNKYNEIWDKIKETLSIKFHGMPVYDKKYIKAKVREFNGVIKTTF